MSSYQLTVFVMNKTTLISIAVVVVAVIVALVILQKEAAKPKIYDSFAACLGEKGATFYGAFWCPHCADQKARFKGSSGLLPYVECSNADRSPTEACLAAGIETYPTWEFADGSRLTGAQSLETLAAKTGCVLPTGDETESTDGIGESSSATN